MKLKITFIVIASLFLGCKSSHNKASYDGKSGATKIVNTLHYSQEKHLKNIKQLTFGGDNAEAYWSFDNKKDITKRITSNHHQFFAYGLHRITCGKRSGCFRNNK